MTTENSSARLAERLDPTFLRLLNAATNAIMIADATGTIVLANRASEDILGYAATELIGRSVEILVPARQRNAHMKLREDYMHHPEGRYMGQGREVRAVHKNGRVFPLEVALTPLDIGGETFVVAVAKDMTAEKRAQRALERKSAELARSNAELQQFAYVASHDLQEPLRMIASYTELFSRRYRGQLDAEADEFIEYILEGASRMRDLINDLLVFSRIGGGERAKEQVDLNEILSDVAYRLQTAIKETDAVIEYEALPTVFGSRVEYVELFQNLLSNAIKFRGDNTPHIEIEARPVEGRYAFTVRDNGIGIEAKYAERIFQVFQRLHSKQDYKGTGIGLAICRRVVEKYGGSIRVESAPAEGAAFLFTLPATAEPSED